MQYISVVWACSSLKDTILFGTFIQVDQLDAQILIVCLYLSLDALHVSDSLVHHQERSFGAVYRNWYKLVRLAVVWLLPHNSQTYGTGEARFSTGSDCVEFVVYILVLR